MNRRGDQAIPLYVTRRPDTHIAQREIVAEHVVVGGAARPLEAKVRAGDGRVVVWRGEDGRAHVTSAFCPHLGASLEAGDVVGQRVRCAGELCL